MMNEAIEKNCPDHGMLVDFLQGRLVSPELDDCEAHLEVCDACHETLGGINPSDTLSEVVAKAMQSQKSAANGAEIDDAEVVRSLVQRLAKPAGFAASEDKVSGVALLRDRAAEVLLHVAPDPEDPESLGVLAGFRLRELIGAGGTGIVFRADDLSLEREIALKVLRPSLGDLARERFVAEARAAASIDHENVVTIYQVGQHERLAWIAMKWVPGETLESRLKCEGSLAEEEVRRLSIQIASGLAEAHRQQLVHRDIKPANLWIGHTDLKIRILDFGLVRIPDTDPALTPTGVLAGTPSFMSPEQVKGQELDARSDLFSLGCVMYQMITGTLPFDSPSVLATLQAIQTRQPEPPILLDPDCSDELSGLTMALLEKHASDRIESAESLVRCLETPRCDWPIPVREYRCSESSPSRSVSPPVATTTKGSMFGAGNWVGAVLLGLFGFGMWLFASFVIRIATKQGELVIETEDKDVTVTVSKNGDLVRVLNVDSETSFDIRSDDFKISAVGKDDQTELEVKPALLVVLLAQDGHWLAGQTTTISLQWHKENLPESNLVWTLGHEDVAITSGTVAAKANEPPSSISMDLPPVRVRTPLQLKYQLVRAGDGKKLQEGSASAVAYPNDILEPLPKELAGRSIVVWDSRGDLADAFSNASIKHKHIKRESQLRLSHTDLIVVGAGEIKDSPFSQSRLTTYVQRGSNALILEQTSVKALVGIRLRSVPVSQGINWPGSHPLQLSLLARNLPGNITELKAMELEPATEAGSVSTVIAQPKSHDGPLPSALVGEISMGEGRIVFCQLPLDPFDTDPRSQLFLRDAIRYLCLSSQENPQSGERVRATVPR